MADHPDQFEHGRMQLAGSLNAVAESLRNCAAIADHFAQIVRDTPFTTRQIMHGLVKNSPLPAAATGKRKAKVVEEEDPLDPDSKKKRKARGPKKIRDPDMPKRPASSYLLFQNEVRKELKSKNPNMSQTELLPAIAKLWSEMTPDQKLVYTSATAMAKEKYHQEKAAYDARGPSTAAIVVVPPPPAQTPTNNKTFDSPKSRSIVSSSDPGSSSSDGPSEDEADDDDDEEEIEERPPAKKAKQTSKHATPPTVKKKPKRA